MGIKHIPRAPLFDHDCSDNLPEQSPVLNLTDYSPNVRNTSVPLITLHIHTISIIERLPHAETYIRPLFAS
jgi:hypothetical protein